ncbi:hypothetical protein COLO4_37685 [Corchorus olitorius]|uniref:Uncharacterized protein n=1 Tax=Corchorus olitorius TaxID=93759 RepID=A0A1R3FZY4_9ROSI|nr:hypothetical protein COLO4_37685 [Corchorus olitorius]
MIRTPSRLEKIWKVFMHLPGSFKPQLDVNFTPLSQSDAKQVTRKSGPEHGAGGGESSNPPTRLSFRDAMIGANSPGVYRHDEFGVLGSDEGNSSDGTNEAEPIGFEADGAKPDDEEATTTKALFGALDQIPILHASEWTFSPVNELAPVYEVKEAQDVNLVFDSPSIFLFVSFDLIELFY